MSPPHARRIAVSRFSDRATEVSASVTTHSPWSNSIVHGSPPTSTSQRLPLSRSCSFADMTIIIENALLARRRNVQAAEREKGRNGPDVLTIALALLGSGRLEVRAEPSLGR